MVKSSDITGNESFFFNSHTYEHVVQIISVGLLEFVPSYSDSMLQLWLECLMIGSSRC
jgi:hypothetical protein